MRQWLVWGLVGVTLGFGGAFAAQWALAPTPGARPDRASRVAEPREGARAPGHGLSASPSQRAGAATEEGPAAARPAAPAGSTRRSGDLVDRRAPAPQRTPLERAALQRASRTGATQRLSRPAREPSRDAQTSRDTETARSRPANPLPLVASGGVPAPDVGAPETVDDIPPPRRATGEPNSPPDDGSPFPFDDPESEGDPEGGATDDGPLVISDPRTQCDDLGSACLYGSDCCSGLCQGAVPAYGTTGRCE